MVPDASLHAGLEQLVGASSFVVDAASWGVVSRPRLWWSNVLQLSPLPSWLDLPDGGSSIWQLIPNPQFELVPVGSQVSEKSRCKMLGNAWHLPTARFILFVLLASCNVIPVSAGPVQAWYPPSCPLPWSSNLHPLGARPIESTLHRTTRASRGH